MLVMMPGFYDSFAHRYQSSEWQRSERFDYCDKALPTQGSLLRVFLWIKHLFKG